MADKWIQLQSSDGGDNLFPTSHMDLLWTNANPTGSFAAQTVSLDLSSYRFVYIETIYNAADANNRYINYNLCIKNTKVTLIGDQGEGGAIGRRSANISDTGITFTTGYINGSSNADACVPKNIYGIK